MRRNLLAIKGNRGSVRESRVGAASVDLIIKHITGKGRLWAKQKARDYSAESEVVGIETPEARKLAVDFAAGILCEQPGRNWQYVKVGRGREWAERQISA